MGLSPFSKCSCDESVNSCCGPLPSRPDPNAFRIERGYRKGEYIALQANYPNCTNYEGNKILVFKATPWELLPLNSLDPHFCENHLSPIARFAPTEEGWEDAKAYVKSKSKGKWWKG